MIPEIKYNAYMQIIQMSIESLNIIKMSKANDLKFMRQLEFPELFSWKINYWNDAEKFEEQVIKDFTDLLLNPKESPPVSTVG